MIKLAAVSMVKNECDIIELFLKINLRTFDRIFLIDHSSQDGTLEIAQEMKNKFPQIEIISNFNKEFRQSQVITSLVRRVAADNIVDFIVPLDADEFMPAHDSPNTRDKISKFLRVNQSGLIPWETYCPISSDYFSSETPLYSCFKKIIHEPKLHYKVILGNEFAKDCVIAEGNHNATSKKYPSPAKILDLKLLHVPVRSSEQVIRKALMGSHSLALKRSRQRGEGAHWDHMAEIIRKNNYSLNADDLTKMALQYISKDGCNAVIDFNSTGVGLDKDEINLSHLMRPNLIRDMDLLALNLVAQTTKTTRLGRFIRKIIIFKEKLFNIYL